MTTTRPGVDRIGRQALQAAAITAERTRDKHEQECYRCLWAGKNVRQKCGTWWELSRTAHRARRALRKWSEPETKGMQPLFTEAECDPPPY